MATIFYDNSRYQEEYKRIGLGQMIDQLTVTPEHIGMDYSPDKQVVYDYHLNQEAKINGLFLAYKDFIKSNGEEVLTIRLNLRKSTLLLKNAI